MLSHDPSSNHCKQRRYQETAQSGKVLIYSLIFDHSSFATLMQDAVTDVAGKTELDPATTGKLDLVNATLEQLKTDVFGQFNISTDTIVPTEKIKELKEKLDEVRDAAVGAGAGGVDPGVIDKIDEIIATFDSLQGQWIFVTKNIYIINFQQQQQYILSIISFNNM
jgi:hypothetical protein